MLLGLAFTLADKVTSFTLVWIKITDAQNALLKMLGHELHARVD